MSEADLARLLVECGAVELRENPDDWFTWSSGKRAPIYCDNRLLLSFPSARAQIADALCDSLLEHFGTPELIAGTATAGIPHAAWVAERMDLPMVYVRGSAKQHGKQRRVEGRALDGERVVLIEDTISLGGSSASAVEALSEEGGKVLGVQAIFSYDFPAAQQRLAALGVPWQALVRYPALLDLLELSSAARERLLRWREEFAS